MKKILILAALVSLSLGSISCDNDDTNEVNHELQAIEKDKIEHPGDTK